MKKLAKIWNAATTLFVVMLILLAVFLMGVRIGGLQPMYVSSGSMEPAFHVGSLIFVQKIDPDKIEVGDPITYTINAEGDYSTHRVIDIAKFETGTRQVLAENGQPLLSEDGGLVYEEYPLEETCYYFYTKGDANEHADGTPVYYKNVVGVPKMTIPYLGYLAHWLHSTKGRIMGIAIALVLVILTFLPDLLRWVDKVDKKNSDRPSLAAVEDVVADNGKEG